MLDDLTDLSIAAAIRIHKSMGPGLLESVYERLMYEELRKHGLDVARQQPISFTYNDIQFENGFRADLIVERSILLEIKAVELIKPVHKRQVLTYLRLMQFRLGLLLNFNAETMREGISRIANDFDPGEGSLLRVNLAASRVTPETAAPSPPLPDSQSAPPAAPA